MGRKSILIDHCGVESDSQREIGVQEEGVNGAGEASSWIGRKKTMLRDIFK